MKLAVASRRCEAVCYGCTPPPAAKLRTCLPEGLPLPVNALCACTAKRCATGRAHCAVRRFASPTAARGPTCKW